MRDRPSALLAGIPRKFSRRFDSPLFSVGVAFKLFVDPANLSDCLLGCSTGLRPIFQHLAVVLGVRRRFGEILTLYINPLAFSDNFSKLTFPRLGNLMIRPAATLSSSSLCALGPQDTLPNRLIVLIPKLLL